MSNKRNRYRRQNMAVTKKVASPVQERGLFASDGFTNQLAYIGQASKLMTAGHYERASITSNQEQLTNLYRENWIAKRIIDVPAQDMCRAWYTLQTQMEGDKVDQLVKLQHKHNIKGEFTNAIKWARLYGGSACLIVVDGQEDMLEQPLDMDMLQPGCFRGLIVIDRYMGLSPSLQIQDDMDDVDFGYPKYYDVYLDDLSTNFVRVHHSRLITFRGRQLPHTQQRDQDYWGASQLEHIYEQLQKRNTTSANIAQLIFQANIRTLKMSDFGQILAMGTNAQKQRVLQSIAQQNRMINSFGLQVLSAQDGYENHPYSFSGIADVYEKFMSDMAGAAEMPATKLYGRSPEGMNATGDSDMNMYYESIAQKQQKILRPALQRLIPIMAISLWGKVPDDFEVVFQPIATVSASDKASIGGQITGNVVQAFNAGLIGRKTALMQLRENGKELGIWQKITDETIDEADDEVQQGQGGDMGGMMGGAPGEQGGDPMAAMMGGGQPGGQDPMAAMMGGGMPPQAQQKKPQKQSQNEPKQKMDKQSSDTSKAKTGANKAVKQASQSNKQQQDDGDKLKKLSSLINEVYGEQKKPEDLDKLSELIKQYLTQKGTDDEAPETEGNLQKHGDHVQIVVRTSD